VQMTCVFIDCV